MSFLEWTHHTFGYPSALNTDISIHCFSFSLPPSRPSPGPLVIKSLRTRAPIKDHCSGRVPKWKCSGGRETLVLCSYELKITLLSWDYLSPPLTSPYWICWPFNGQFNWYHKRVQTAKPIPTILGWRWNRLLSQDSFWHDTRRWTLSMTGANSVLVNQSPDDAFMWQNIC